MKIVKLLLVFALVSTIAVSCKETKKEEVQDDAAVEMTEEGSDSGMEATDDAAASTEEESSNDAAAGAAIVLGKGAHRREALPAEELLVNQGLDNVGCCGHARIRDLLAVRRFHPQLVRDLLGVTCAAFCPSEGKVKAFIVETPRQDGSNWPALLRIIWHSQQKSIVGD